jgi:hypothetical protein
MTRTQIIAQIDAEISRLERARDFLAAALADAKIVPIRKAKTKAAVKDSEQPAVVVAPVVNGAQGRAVVAPPPPQPKEEPQVHRVPPRRRMERRQLQSDKPGKSPAALSGLVPVGPVAVSADEARKVQERSTPPPMAIEIETRAEIGSERSLGSLIQAFERRAGLSGIEIP